MTQIREEFNKYLQIQRINQVPEQFDADKDQLFLLWTPKEGESAVVSEKLAFLCTFDL